MIIRASTYIWTIWCTWRSASLDYRQSLVKTRVQVVVKIIPQLAPEPTNWKSLIYTKSSSHFEDVKCVLVYKWDNAGSRSRFHPSLATYCPASSLMRVIPTQSCRVAVRTRRTLDRCNTLGSFLACHSKPDAIQPNLQHFPPLPIQTPRWGLRQYWMWS